ncbi:MAG TPA: hypothetical protein VEA40_09730, partial [Ramlibacter sp.]|nr:hypothetical protein [Ramlibacter sp.]
MADTSTSGLRRFAGSALKLAVSITLAFIAFAAICAAAYWAYSYPERQRAKQAEVVRVWSKDLSSNLGMKLRTRTKVTDGMMHMALDFDGYPEFLRHPANRTRGFSLEWKDADGFTRIKKFVPLGEFTAMVDDKGKSYGLNGEFSQFVSVADYSNVVALEVGWTLATEIPKPQAAAPHQAADLADHCAPGLSRQERLRRLALHGSLRETG